VARAPSPAVFFPKGRRKPHFLRIVYRGGEVRRISEIYFRITLSMRRLAIPIVSMLLVTSLLYAAEDVKTAKVLAVKAYDRGRIAFWEGRVPIYDGYAFYDITIALDQKKYVVRYESMTGYYPSAWKAGREIKVRLGSKGKMFLLNGDEEVLALIYNGNLQDCVVSTGRPTVMGPGSQVPCD
jgi:hypothetical protein